MEDLIEGPYMSEGILNTEEVVTLEDDGVEVEKEDGGHGVRYGEE